MANRLLIEDKMDRMIECMEKANEIAEFGEITSKFDGTAKTYHKIMREWFALQTGSPKTLTALCNEWYEITRTGWYGYTTFAQPSVSSVSTGTKGGDNAGLVCVPSTDTVANQDDYAGLPLFAVTTVNWELDDSGKKVITAIKGISSDFESHNPDKYVGVMQMTGYVGCTENASTYVMEYSDTVQGNLKPLPEAIESDGTVNNFVLHGKYMSHTTSGGKMTCCAGVIPTRNMSYNGLVSLSKKNGSYYSGGSIVDWSFLVWMTMIKYGSMTQDGVNQGCVNYNYQYTAAVSESSVSRIILTTTQAANLLVGSTVLLGTNASTDRGTATTYSISGSDGVVITAIESVTIDDTTYSAVYVDSDAFDTTAGTTYLSTYHWTTGTCDSVLGNDGSYSSASNGKVTATIQGIEYSVGGYEVLGDVILYLDGENYCPYVVSDASKQKSNATITTDGYEDSGLRSAQPATDSWNYISKLLYNGEIYLGETDNGSSSKYTKDGFYKNSVSTKSTYREWLAFGTLGTGSGNGGLSCLYGGVGLGGSSWIILARLSPNGNRGELTA